MTPKKDPDPVIVYDLTDLGNALRFAHTHRDLIRYDHLKQRWLIWQKHRWAPDDGPLLKQLVMDFVERTLRAAVEAEIKLQPSERRLTRHWLQANSERGMLAIEHLAKSIPGIADTDGTGWDATPYLLGVPNGVVDLRTGELRDGLPDDRITKQTRVPYDPDAKAPRWEQFLREIHPDDKDGVAIREYNHRCYGYSATGESRAHILMLLVGVGRNGKSVERNAVFFVLGPDYTYVLPFQSLQYVRSTNERQTNDLAPLYRKRMAINSEANRGVKLDTARIKTLTGEDPAAVRFHFKEFFEFTNTATIWIAVNHKPEVPDDSDGMWERVRAVVYPNRYEAGAEGTDDTLKDQFEDTEAMGILAWTVRGAKKFYEEGLGPIPRSVQIATAQYRAQNDPIGEFVNDRVIEVDGATVKTKTLLQSFATYCEEQGVDDRTIPKRKEIVDYLQMRWTETRRNDGMHFIGIRLMTADERLARHGEDEQEQAQPPQGETPEPEHEPEPNPSNPKDVEPFWEPTDEKEASA